MHKTYVMCEQERTVKRRLTSVRATRVRTAVCVRMGLRASPVSVRKTRQVRGKNFPSGKSCGYRWPEMGRAVLSKYYVIMFTYEVARLQAESLL